MTRFKFFWYGCKSACETSMECTGNGVGFILAIVPGLMESVGNLINIWRRFLGE